MAYHKTLLLPGNPALHPRWNIRMSDFSQLIIGDWDMVGIRPAGQLINVISDFAGLPSQLYDVSIYFVFCGGISGRDTLPAALCVEHRAGGRVDWQEIHPRSPYYCSSCIKNSSKVPLALSRALATLSLASNNCTHNTGHKYKMDAK